MIVSTQRQLTHADLCRYEELLHGHRVHVGEVLRHKLLAIVPVTWRKEKDVLTEREMSFLIWRKKTYWGNSSARGRWWTQRSWSGPRCTPQPTPIPWCTRRRCTLYKKLTWKKTCPEFSTPKPFLFIYCFRCQLTPWQPHRLLQFDKREELHPRNSVPQWRTANARLVIWLDLKWNRNEQTNQYITSMPT